MNLDQLFKKLSYGTLSELSIAGEGNGIVPAPNYPKLAFRANEALKALYARFPLDEHALILETVNGLFEYKLHPDFAQSSSSLEPIKYIKDAGGPPFLGRVLMITDVFDSDHRELPLNDRRHKLSWFTRANEALVMDYPLTGARYFINYRRGPVPIPETFEELDGELDNIEFEIPVQLEGALCHHIAGGVYGSMSMESSMAKAGMHDQKYEDACLYHETLNTFNGSQAESNIKPALGGWI